MCGNSECRWAFYDRSRNQQGLWCEMAVCGNRLKNRAFRARKTLANSLLPPDTYRGVRAGAKRYVSPGAYWGASTRWGSGRLCRLLSL